MKKNNSNFDDEFMEELAMEENQKSLANPLNSSTTLNQSPIEELNQTKTQSASDKSSKNHLNPPNEVSDMDSLDTRRILNPETPRETAQLFIQEEFFKNGMKILQCVPSSNEFYVWTDNFYQPICEREVQAKLARFLQFSWKKIKAKDLSKGEEFEIVPFNTSRMKENEVLNALKNICSEGVKQDPAKGPSWLFQIAEELPDPSMIIPFKNKLLSITHFLKSGNAAECLLPLNPKLFDLSQIPFDIISSDHGRLKPVKFIAFLESVFDGDQSAITLLQQWIGYCLTNMTFAQKILLIIGPPRSGKGTIAKVIQTMLGEANFTNPSANSLINDFPLEDWINKRLAILGDARFGDKKQAVKEILLQVSGADRVNVRRKHTTTLTGMVIPTKIMVLSNEMPTLKDNSGALASRFLYLKMTKSFLGSEDPDLFERDLLPEIPLVFWWALDGLRELMLKKKKDFIQAETGKETAQEMKRYQSPVRAFIDEKCNLGDHLMVPTLTFQNAYKKWCEDFDITPLDDANLGKHLRYIYQSIHRAKKGAAEIPHYMSISLKDRS
jgi:putative DNA primase/helicase